MPSPSPAVVTGAGGHVGACLVRELLARGRSVRTIDLESGPAALEGLDVEQHVGDVRDAEFLRSVFRPGDTVFHLASVISTSGDKGGLVSSVNVDGARTVARAARTKGVKRLVHFSSVHAFDIDTHGSPVTEDTRLAFENSLSAYNVSKAIGQLSVLEEVKAGLDAVVVNPCGVIGPYDYKPSRMGKFFRAVARGHTGRVGPAGFNWVDVRDVVAGALAAEERGRTGACYILGGHWASNVALGQMAREHTGTAVPDKPIPMWFLNLLHAASPVLKMMGQRPPVTQEALDALKANRDISHARATAELGYSPRPTEDTVRDVFAWFKDEDIELRPPKKRRPEAG